MKLKTNICRQCNIEFEVKRIDKKICSKKCQRRASYLKNRDKRILTTKKYHENNRDTRLEQMRRYNKEWYKLNKEERKHQVNKYQKKRRKEDPCFKMAYLLRIRLRNALKGIKKHTSLLDNLGCTLEELKVYIESKFEKGMSWENHGEWHIDHIIPLSSYDLSNSEELAKASHFSNLQPLWAIDNLKKGSKIL